jgi:CHAT domain-containing protein
VNARAAAASVLAALLGAHAAHCAHAAQAQAQAQVSTADDPCHAAPAAEPAWLAPDADPEALRRNRPAAALARACARRAATPGPTADLELALALIATSRLSAAAVVLRALPDPPSTDAARPLDAEIALARGLHALDDGRHAEAGPHFDRALAIAQALQLGGRLPARALTGRASVLHTLRPGPDALARAEAALEEAAAQLQRAGLGEAREMGDLLNQRTMLAYARQDLPAAIAHARAEVALVRRLDGPDAPDAFDALASLGAILSQRGQHDEAEAALRDGLRLMALHPGVSPGAQLGVLNNLAALGLDRARWDEAIAFAEQSLALAERAFPGRAGSKIVAMSHRAQALMGQARLAEAQARYEEAWALVRDDPSVPALRRLRLLDNLADLYTRLNDAEAAHAAIDAGLAITQRDAHFGYWRGRLLRHRATLAATAGRWAEADALHAEATPLIAATIGADHVYTLVSTVQRCLAQVQGRLPGEACSELQAREGNLADAAAAHRFRVQHALAAAADAAGRTDDARRHHLQALAAAQSAATPHPLWVAYDALARHLRGQRANAIAIALGKAAVAQVEAMRRDLSGAARDSERHFLTDKHAVYRRLADWLAEDGRIDEALDVLGLLKAEELLDFERRAGAAARASPGPLLTERERRWQAQAPRDGAPTASAAPTTGAPPPATEAPRPSAAALEAARVAAWQALLDEAAAATTSTTATAAAGASATASGAPTPPSAAAPRPPAGELHAWYFSGPTHLNLVLDGPRGRQLLRQPLAEPLGPRIGQLLSLIGRRADAQPLLQALHAELAAPLLAAARQTQATRLVLHLDGPLRYLPFAALHDGRQPLGARFAVEQRLSSTGGPSVNPALAPAPPAAVPPRTVNTAGVPTATPTATPSSTISTEAAPLYVRAFGVTRALSGLPALPAVAGEVCGIVDGDVQGLDGSQPCARGLLPGAGWLDAAFTPAQLRRAAAAGNATRRDLLHLGTHFVLRPGHIGRSWLLTGDAQRLSLDELAAIELRGQALVTLSACETGLGGAEGADGREVDGLAAVLARRGAGAVIASLWRVDDRSTGALMRALYAALAQGAAPAAALQQAQQRVRDTPGGAWRHPFHWAGFTLLSGPGLAAPLTPSGGGGGTAAAALH